MKKQIAVVLIATFILTNITACHENVPQIQPENQVSVSDSSSPVAEASNTKSDNTQTTASESDTDINTENEPAEKVRAIYGETEIPDIACGSDTNEGKASTVTDSEALKQCLDSMVFETHTFGDYKVSLVGDNVRIDKENFPDSIYTQKLRIEVEKNGVKISRDGYYCDTFVYVSQFAVEYRLFTDKIGSYIDIYELDYPVIAMRYYYVDDSKSSVKSAVEFATIQNDEVCNGFVGVSEKGTGVVLNPDTDRSESDPMLVLNPEDGANCRISVFESDKFNIVDSKTLSDEAAGIKYTFNFSDPPQYELYTSEKIQ